MFHTKSSDWMHIGQYSCLWTPPSQTMTEIRIDPTISQFDSPIPTVTKPPCSTVSSESKTTNDPMMLPSKRPTTSAAKSFPLDAGAEAARTWLAEGISTSPSQSKRPRTAEKEARCFPTVLETKLTESAGTFGRLGLTFLPAEERMHDGSTKFGKIAEVTRLADGTVKLFAERGRAIDTHILFDPRGYDETNQLRLRFTPFSSCAGVRKPVIGYHNQVQKNQYSQSDQLCFIQLAPSMTCACQYVTDEDGYCSMEIPLMGCSGIYPLVFPFHNSQCPTTCRKTVYIRVCVLTPDGTEIAFTQFQVISCASPLRDFQRFQAKMDTDNHAYKRKCRKDNNAKRPGDKQWNNTVDLDISPGSSGFASSSSSSGCMNVMIDEDVNSCHFRDQSYSQLALKELLDVDAIQCSNTIGDCEDVNRETVTNKYPVSYFPCGTGLQTHADCVSSSSAISMKHNPNTETQNASGEYVIKTKNWHIYRILKMMEHELTLFQTREYRLTSTSMRFHSTPALVFWITHTLLDIYFLTTTLFFQFCFAFTRVNKTSRKVMDSECSNVPLSFEPLPPLAFLAFPILK